MYILQSGKLLMPVKYIGGPTTVPFLYGFVLFVHSQDYAAWLACTWFRGERHANDCLAHFQLLCDFFLESELLVKS